MLRSLANSAGGDGGNRTRVQRTRPQMYYKLSQPFVSHPLHPRPTECEAGQAIRDRGPGLGPPYRRQERRTPIAMTPAPGPSEESLGRRSRSGRLERSQAVYAAIGSAARLVLALASVVLPRFHEGRAPRLAIRDQPSLSKPVIPCIYIIPHLASLSSLHNPLESGL
jgi:hypothetical protein